MMSSRRLLLSAFLLAAAGCADPTAPGELGQLDAARARWRAQGGASYTVEINRGCFCVLGGRRMTVTVRNGAVVGADYLDSGGPVETTLLTYIPTIPDLFDLIQDALNRGPAMFLAVYDPTYGYPTRIEIDYSASVADDELAITTRDLLIDRSITP
jgi:hypothetical protein